MDNIKDDKGINFEVRTWKNKHGTPVAQVNVPSNPPLVNLCVGDQIELTSKDGYVMTIKFDWETIPCPTCQRGGYCEHNPKPKRRFPWFPWIRL